MLKSFEYRVTKRRDGDSETENMSEEKQLHIDEDWKAQVEQDKQKWRDQQRGQQPAQEPGDTRTDHVHEVDQQIDQRAGAQAAAGRQLPPPSMLLLITTLSSQAMVAMGVMPAEDGKLHTADLEVAKHFIDMLGVLEDKTRNNLTQEETGYLGGTLHQLRLLFVEQRNK
jgi:Domain of unknown function (DUF1844)